MRGSTSMVLGSASGLVGLALMVIETVRVLNGSALDTLNNALLFVGLALLAVGGGLLVVAVIVGDDTAAATAPDGPTTETETDTETPDGAEAGAEATSQPS